METVMQDYEVDQIEKEEIPDVIGIEYDERGRVVGISAEEWCHKLGNMLLNHFGEEMRIPLNQSLQKHGMKSLH